MDVAGNQGKASTELRRLRQVTPSRPLGRAASGSSSGAPFAGTLAIACSAGAVRPPVAAKLSCELRIGFELTP